MLRLERRIIEQSCNEFGLIAMRTLMMGAKGAEVLFLQRQLNKRGAGPRLAEDEDFGRLTHNAVVTFQQAQRIIPANGIADGRVWSRFGALAEFQHNIRLFGQPTGMTCWSAAATMMIGNMSVGPGAASLGARGGLDMDIDNVETFVRGLGWRFINNQSAPPVTTLVAGIALGPLWIAFEGGDFRHAVIASAVWSDNSDDGSVFRIHDPWPQNRGTVYGTPYVDRRMTLRSVTPHKIAMVQYVASAR